jgi:hypothetical protein
MKNIITPNDTFALVRPSIDAHSLGISSIAQLLHDCNINTLIANHTICTSANEPWNFNKMVIFSNWIRQNKISHLGFSYRLDPEDGIYVFRKLFHQIKDRKLLFNQSGPIKRIFFAGLPNTCKKIYSYFGNQIELFYGDETIHETLNKLNIPLKMRPKEINETVSYDKSRLSFAYNLIKSEKHLQINSINRSEYIGYGTKKDRVVNRIKHGIQNNHPPLMRTHIGPYSKNKKECMKLYKNWCKELSKKGLLDILSIGTSQLTQSHFGKEWGNKPNGGGVPINSPEEFHEIWKSSLPMLVRTYAGTTNMPKLASMYEKSMNIAWHTFSLWWFCEIDGRGPHSVKENLELYFETFKVISKSGKPYEPNVPHHFAFRGSDDLTYIVSALLAAKAAKKMNVPYLILQLMLNTPKHTWGIQDLAKARATLSLIKELENHSFKVYLQPRAGLDYFSHNLEKAKEQLAAVTALMDDILPWDSSSPEIIHVVNYSEGSHLADPQIVNESIQITRAALIEYRKYRKLGLIEDMSQNQEVIYRTKQLIQEAKSIITTIEKYIPNPYSPKGLFSIFYYGFLPTPYLWEKREEFFHATQWQTKLIKGGVRLVDQQGAPINLKNRLQININAFHTDLKQLSIKNTSNSKK